MEGEGLRENRKAEMHPQHIDSSDSSKRGGSDSNRPCQHLTASLASYPSAFIRYCVTAIQRRFAPQYED